MSKRQTVDNPTKSAEAKIRVMVVDEDEQRGHMLVATLVASDYEVVGNVAADDYLPAKVKDLRPDVVLVDIDAPSRDTLERISAVHRSAPRPVVMLTQDEDMEMIGAAIRAGVSAYVVDGLSRSKVEPIINVAIAQYKEFQGLREELEKTKTTLADRKDIDRAKGILMQKKSISEPEAYRLLQKIAMDQKKKLADVAREVNSMAALIGS